jgi:DNA mismatch repair protein MutS
MQETADTITPVRRQYLEVKRRFPEAILFFRLGDFYETFDDDARTCARELEITLTTKPIGKNQRVPLAGVPYHAVDGYLARLIARGYKVAVCDQVGEAPNGRGMIERRVTRVVTPGTVLEEGLIDGRHNNFLAAVVADGERCGLAYADVSTGEFATTCLPEAELRAELTRLHPAELLVGGEDAPSLDGVCESITALDAQAVSLRAASERLLAHFRSSTLEPYGCANLPPAICAAAAVLRYLQETQPDGAALIARLSTYSTADHMTLDPQTRRNLEIFESSRDGGRDGSLIAAVDATRTAMGGRLLRQRLSQPLLDPGAINVRLDAVEWFCSRGVLRDRLLALMTKIPDLERLLTRIAAGRAAPRELAGLGRGLQQALAIADLLAAELDAPVLPQREIVQALAACLAAALADEPPATLEAGGVIREGYSPELDGLRRLVGDARDHLAALEQRERERTGLRSLKVGYNRVFGYYIEVSNAYRGELPADYQRRQTLAGAERYTTQDLKEYESRVLGAQEQIEELEGSLFHALCGQISAAGEAIRGLSSALAALDLDASLAEVAALRGYVRPRVDGSDRLFIKQGRHPVVERSLPAGAFVANDTELSAHTAQIVVLTGPNMAGKSTYLRQVALIVLLAQCGSFVPAEAAEIGVVDRIFTRVGAQDDLAAGNSTFMVEMVEAAQILAHATPRSLVVLDEVGRGTSTYDGLAIAQAILEYLHNREQAAARTLFATHYHELVRLARVLPRLRNCNVAVSERDGEVVFLRTILPGGADRSYGIHVAQLAGLPRPVIARAQEILSELESAKNNRQPGRRSRAQDGIQLGLLTPRHPLLDELAELDVDALSPLDAIRTLYELRERAKGER